jgi:hypothetical protein
LSKALPLPRHFHCQTPSRLQIVGYPKALPFAFSSKALSLQELNTKRSPRGTNVARQFRCHPHSHCSFQGTTVATSTPVANQKGTIVARHLRCHFYTTKSRLSRPTTDKRTANQRTPNQAHCQPKRAPTAATINGQAPPKNYHSAPSTKKKTTTRSPTKTKLPPALSPPNTATSATKHSH